ncbi:MULTISPECIES: 5'-methylthioadenosine/adenosylhomocysteine nucleosidase [Clostridium]|uniref:5'-methylthioadenosine/adenosylhomocysteine nucleosidase n=1 Tax=Clostridium TaxID=1485 RepID=UPI002590487D|nr:5'-methylthioadenosine/adenosylhomocysteine nucleosidase [Clostridium sp.]MCI6139806.1 5'-methylthioadenosine/adenosylhomocysteine nucleosidase [Clostridium sp.]
MLGIIGAMDEEVVQLKDQMTEIEVETRASMDFYKGKLGGRGVVVVRSGIGKVNAAMCTQILADLYKADAVINTGIAGSLKAEIDIGDIVLSEDALQYDMDATNFGYELGQVPRLDTLAFKANEDLLRHAKECCAKVNPDIQVFTGRVVTGDQFISQQNKKVWLSETFGGCCTEMEGAAIAQACYLNHIPFLIIRAISDKADDSAVMDYPAFEAQAIIHSVRLVTEMIRTF